MKHNNATAITPHRPKRRETGLIFHELKIKSLLDEIEVYGNSELIQRELAHHKNRINEIKQSRS